MNLSHNNFDGRMHLNVRGVVVQLRRAACRRLARPPRSSVLTVRVRVLRVAGLWYALQIKALSKLVALDLSHNSCDLASLQQLALGDKPHLRTLDISFNQLCVAASGLAGVGSANSGCCVCAPGVCAHVTHAYPVCGGAGTTLGRCGQRCTCCPSCTR